MVDISNLTELQLDALKEISSIASGNASIAMSKLLGGRIDIIMPHSQIVPLEGVCDLLGGADKLVSVVYIWLTGETSGSFLFVCSNKEALELTSTLTGKDSGALEELGEFEQSALKELANIVAGSYFKAISIMLSMKIEYSFPIFAADMLGAIIDEILIKLGMEVEHAIVIETEFIIKKESVKGHLLFLPDPSGLEIIFKKLGVEVKND